MFGFKEWIRSLFKKKVLIYTAIGHNDYFRIVNKLTSQGVKYQTKIPIDNRTRGFISQPNKQYYIYVYLEDEGRAIAAIHTS